MNFKKNIVVNVCMLTFNHEKYIQEAIEGVLMQKCNFDYALVIGEDCSTDKTKQICQEYASKYSGINLLTSETNLGMVPNFIRTLHACTGRYISLCEGDDYWTDPYKLQKQVDFLEANEDFAITFCNVLVKYEDSDNKNHKGYQKEKMPSNNPIQTFPVPNETTDIYDIAKGNYIHTPGVVFRNILRDVSLPRYMSTVPIGDWPLYMFISQYGKIRYFNEIMAVYRVHNNGVFSSSSEVKKECLGLEQYPAMINEGIFDEKIIQIWGKHVSEKLTFILKNNLNEINDQDLYDLLHALNKTKPSLLKKSIELLTEEINEHKNTILSIRSSRAYQLSSMLFSIMRKLKRLFSRTSLQK